MIRPESIVRLCAVPLDQTQQHQIKFDSKSSQAAYFAGRTVQSFTEFTYIRADRSIVVPVNIDDLYTVNYAMYDNGGRWFYAFIERLEYVSENATRVIIKTDVFQTWMLDVTLLPSFVEREHVASDVIGEHTIPESLESGEYIVKRKTEWTELDNLAVILAISATSAGDDAYGRIVNGVYSCLAYVPFFGTNYQAAIESFLDAYDATGRAAAVVAAFTYPVALLPSGTTSGTAITGNNTLAPIVQKSVTVDAESINGYVPKNKKLFCYPYNLLHCTNLQGQSVDLQLELFNGGYPGSVSFSAYGAVVPGAKVMAIPNDYKIAEDQGLEFGLTLGNYPMCAWVADAWKNWIAQNAVTLMGSAAGSALSIASGVYTANPMAIGGGLVSIAQSLGQLYAKSIEPPSVGGNINNSTVHVAAGLQHFAFMQMQIRPEYAQIIDDYFTMFGYKVNRVKVPEMASRPYWNYVKTIDINLTGAIPTEDMSELKKLFNQGITLWHSAANVGNYSLDNSIVEA